MALEDAGRADLANVYERAMSALHVDGYYGQQLTRRQAERLREVKEAVGRELERRR